MKGIHFAEHQLECGTKLDHVVTPGFIKDVTTNCEQVLMSALRQPALDADQSSFLLLKTSLTAMCGLKLDHGVQSVTVTGR